MSNNFNVIIVLINWYYIFSLTEKSHSQLTRPSLEKDYSYCSIDYCLLKTDISRSVLLLNMQFLWNRCSIIHACTAFYVCLVCSFSLLFSFYFFVEFKIFVFFSLGFCGKWCWNWANCSRCFHFIIQEWTLYILCAASWLRTIILVAGRKFYKTWKLKLWALSMTAHCYMIATTIM